MAQASAPAGPSENGLLTACLPPRKRFQARSGRRPSRQRKSPCGCPGVPPQDSKSTSRRAPVSRGTGEKCHRVWWRRPRGARQARLQPQEGKQVSSGGWLCDEKPRPSPPKHGQKYNAVWKGRAHA